MKRFVCLLLLSAVAGCAQMEVEGSVLKTQYLLTGEAVDAKMRAETLARADEVNRLLAPGGRFDQSSKDLVDKIQRGFNRLGAGGGADPRSVNTIMTTIRRGLTKYLAEARTSYDEGIALVNKSGAAKSQESTDLLRQAAEKFREGEAKVRSLEFQLNREVDRTIR